MKQAPQVPQVKVDTPRAPYPRRLDKRQTLHLPRGKWLQPLLVMGVLGAILGGRFGGFLVGFPRAASAAGVGDKAPDFSLPRVGGGTVQLSALVGQKKVVLVDFWASWCEPCKKELPLLSQLASRLRASGIEIVAVNIDKSRDKAEAFLRSRKIDGLTVVFNSDLSVADRYQPPTMPSSFGVDRQGRIRFVHAGFQPGDEQKLERELLKLAK